MKKKIYLLIGLLLTLLVYIVGSSLEKNADEQSQSSDIEASSVLLNEDAQTHTHTQKQEEYSPPTSEDDEIQNSEEIYSFRTEELLNSHYQKHGDEFGDLSKEEYLLGANNLINSSFSDVLTKYEDEDDDKIYYSENTNEFLVLSSDGYIRTYFKPDDGIEYYNRQ